METLQRAIPQEMDGKTGKRIYEIENTNISVNWVNFTPTEIEAKDPTKAVIFMPGWSILHDAKSLRPMGQALANYSQGNAFIVDTITEKVATGSLTQEAKAVVDWVREKGFNNLTLIGNSQAAAEIIHAIPLLQEAGIQIDGVGFIDPVSLKEQSRRKLLSTYVLDVVKTHLALPFPTHIHKESNVRSQNLKYDIDGITGIFKGIFHAQIIGWPAKIWNEISEMAKQNPDLAKINVPVVLIQGANDRISDPNETATSPHTPKNHIEDLQTREKKLKVITAEGLVDDIPYPYDSTTREQHLQQTIFPNSPFVRMVVPKKMGYHNVSYSRPESTAKTILYLLKRAKREKSA